MSKSEHDVDPQELQIEDTLTRSERLELEDAKHRRNAKIYGVATLLLALAAIFAVIWNSGIIQRNTPAATVGGEDVSAGELSYYYSAAMQSETQNVYYGTSSYDYYSDPADQMYDDTRTYRDYFLEQALMQVQSVRALNDAAQAEGFVVDASTIDAQLAEAITNLGNYAYSSGLTDTEAYLSYAYGSSMTMDLFKQVFTEQAMASEYVDAKGEEMAVTPEKLETYYNENSGLLDTHTISYMVLLATEPTAEEGEELTEKELADGLEQNRATQEANANAILDGLSAGGDFMELGEQYDVYGAYEHDNYMGMRLNSSFSEWVMSDDRQAGDTTVVEYSTTGRYVYYVVRYESSARDDSPTANIRHIFLSAGTDPSEMDYTAAEASAKAVLENWEEGEATPESFGQLAMTYSADSSSASAGGVITGVCEGSGYVDSFEKWCIDPSREPGDTGLVLNEEGSTKGWHVMYFDGWAGPQWELAASDTILMNEITTWHDGLLEAMPAELCSGTRYIGQF